MAVARPAKRRRDPRIGGFRGRRGVGSVLFVVGLLDSIGRGDRTELSIDAPRETAPLAYAVDHGATNSQKLAHRRKGTPRDSSKVRAACKSPSRPKDLQVVERHRARGKTLGQPGGSIEIHEIELRVKTREDLGRVGRDGSSAGRLHDSSRDDRRRRSWRQEDAKNFCFPRRRDCPIVAGLMHSYVRSAWRSWLTALATDAEAAIAAALTYESLPGEVRDAWLDAIAAEATTLRVPAVAVYAPLLGVEADPGRLERMRAAVTADPASVDAVEAEPFAWMGVSVGGVHACVFGSSIYLVYVRVLTCRYTPSGGFVSAAAYDPLRHLAHVFSMRGRRRRSGGADATLPVVVDELAHAVLADRRQNRASPHALQSFVDLFVPEAKWSAFGPALCVWRRTRIKRRGPMSDPLGPALRDVRSIRLVSMRSRPLLERPRTQANAFSASGPHLSTRQALVDNGFSAGSSTLARTLRVRRAHARRVSRGGRERRPSH